MVAKHNANHQSLVVVKHMENKQSTPWTRNMSYKKSLQQAAEGCFGAIYENAILEIVSFLRAHPERILALQHTMYCDSDFQFGFNRSADWLHPTVVQFTNVEETLLSDVLLDYLKNQKGDQIWTDDVIRKIDKRHGHVGVSQMTEFLGSMSMSDQLESRLHYKPLLKAVLLARFEELGESVIYAPDMHIAFGNEKGIYQLSDKKDGVYNAITHVRLNVSVPLPVDFRVTDESWTLVDNHSWLRCTLQGKQYSIKVLQVFTDCDLHQSIVYPRTSLLTALTDKHFPSYKTGYEASGGDRAKCSSASTTIPPVARPASVDRSIVGGGLAPDAVVLPHGSAGPSFGAARELLSD
jgi:hypothetical protein